MLQIFKLSILQQYLHYLIFLSGVQLQTLTGNQTDVFSEEIALFGQVEQKCITGVAEDDFILNEVVGGRDATPARFPYLVSLQFPHPLDVEKKFAHWCGGTLITNDLILTAAHCIVSSGVDFRAQESSNQGMIRPGELFASLNPQCRHMVGESRHEVVEYFLPKDYSGNAVEGNDIAVLKVSRAFDYEGPFVNYGGSLDVNLQDQSIYTAVGWGATNYTEIQLEKYFDSVVPLQMGFIYNQETDYCQQALQDQYLTSQIDPLTMLCFQSQGTDTCFGDSGSPVLLADGQYGLNLDGNPAKDIQVAIASWGPDISCGGVSGLPGVYTNVSNYVSWIDSIVFENQGIAQKLNQIPSQPLIKISNDQNSTQKQAESFDSLTTITPTLEDINDDKIENVYIEGVQNGAQQYLEGVLVADSYVQYSANTSQKDISHQNVYNTQNYYQQYNANVSSEPNDNTTQVQFEEVVLSVAFAKNTSNDVYNNLQPETEDDEFEDIFTEDTWSGIQLSYEDALNVEDVRNADNDTQYTYDFDNEDYDMQGLINQLVASTEDNTQYLDDILYTDYDNFTQSSNFSQNSSNNSFFDSNQQKIQEKESLQYVQNAQNDSQSYSILDIVIASTQDDLQYFEDMLSETYENETYTEIPSNDTQLVFSVEDNRLNQQYSQHSQDLENEVVDIDYLMKSQDIRISQILYFDSPDLDDNNIVYVEPVIINYIPQINNSVSFEIDQLKKLIENGSTFESNIEISSILYFENTYESDNNSQSTSFLDQQEKNILSGNISEIVLNQDNSEIDQLKNIVEVDPQNHGSNIQISRILYFDSKQEKQYEEVTRINSKNSSVDPIIGIQANQKLNSEFQNVDVNSEINATNHSSNGNEIEWLKKIIEIGPVYDSNIEISRVLFFVNASDSNTYDESTIIKSQQTNQQNNETINHFQYPSNSDNIVDTYSDIYTYEIQNLSSVHNNYYNAKSEKFQTDVQVDDKQIQQVADNNTQINNVQRFNYPSNSNNIIDTYNDIYTYEMQDIQQVNGDKIQISQVIYFGSPIPSNQSQDIQQAKLHETESDLVEGSKLDELQPVEESNVVSGDALAQGAVNQGDNEYAWLQKVISQPENSPVPLQKVVSPPPVLL